MSNKDNNIGVTNTSASIKETKKNTGSATHSCNGYIYQHYFSVYKYFEKYDEFISLLEEGTEDVDIKYINNLTKVIQLKYYKNNNNPESLSLSSDLFKCILRRIKDGDYTKQLVYIVYSKSTDTFNKNLMTANNDEIENLGIFSMILIYNMIIKKKNNNNK